MGARHSLSNEAFKQEVLTNLRIPDAATRKPA